MRYKVLSTITHVVEERLVPPGEVVSLDHLSQEAIQQLMAEGVVEPVTDDVTQEVKKEE